MTDEQIEELRRLLGRALDILARARDIGNNKNIDDDNNKKKKERGKKETKTAAPPDAASADSLLAAFREACDKAASLIPHNVSPTPRRTVALRARQREHGAEAVLTVWRKAAASPFLNGRNARAWTATIDWLLRPNNFVKVLEGNYDDNDNAKPNGYGDYDRQQAYARRRGTPAARHSAADYEEE